MRSCFGDLSPALVMDLRMEALENVWGLDVGEGLELRVDGFGGGSHGSI